MSADIRVQLDNLAEEYQVEYCIVYSLASKVNYDIDRVIELLEDV